MLIMLNIDNLDHATMYRRPDAFFDLDRKRHSKIFGLLKPNIVCCVISYVDAEVTTGDVSLSFWIYQNSLADESEDTWYMVGSRICELTIPKEHLREEPHFKDCFNRNGDFKQFSIQSRP